MSGRDLIPHHIREARQHVDAERWDKTHRRLRDVVAGTTHEDFLDSYRWMTDADNHLTEAQVSAVRDSLQRSAIVPGALTVSCPDHGAETGEHCFRTARAVCKNRLRRVA